MDNKIRNEDLIEQAFELSLHLNLSSLNWIDIKLDKGLVSIESRPPYCDRGRFIVRVFSNCVETFYIDSADSFPRYYFVFENLLSELTHWLAARNVNIISINFFTGGTLTKQITTYADNDKNSEL